MTPPPLINEETRDAMVNELRHTKVHVWGAGKEFYVHLSTVIGRKEDMDKIVNLVTAYGDKRERAVLDKLIGLNSKTFNQWTQKDIAQFFESVGIIYREIGIADLERAKND